MGRSSSLCPPRPGLLLFVAIGGVIFSYEESLPLIGAPPSRNEISYVEPQASGGWSCTKLGLFISIVPFACAIGLFSSWQHDNGVLRRQAIAVTAGLDINSARIRAVNDWVYHNKGFAKNNEFFIVPALGPTPLEVMERGGDCSDKSRLVAAMLNSLGVNAGLVMIAQCSHCGFIHTVVEAQYEYGRMVVDPIWDVDYPTGDGRFLGIRDLAGTNRGLERVETLQHQRPRSDKIAAMPATEATFDYAVAMNWDRDIGTRTVAGMLRLMGYQPENLFRPRLLEDPKLFLAVLLIGTGTTIILVGFLLDFGLGSIATRTRLRIID